jgi:hypothetical protein
MDTEEERLEQLKGKKQKLKQKDPPVKARETTEEDKKNEKDS